MGAEAIYDWFSNNEQLDYIVELKLKPGGDDYATCAGVYNEYDDEFSGAKIFSNSELHRVILFYGDRFQVTSWDWYPDFMCNCKTMGAGFHGDLSGSSDIGSTIWKEYELVVLQGALLGHGMAAAVTALSFLALTSF